MYTFSIDVTTSPNELLAYLKNEILSNDGTFEGDEHSGTFSGKGIKGSYVLEDMILSITILKKPFFIPMKMVENEIRKYVTTEWEA